MRHGLVMSWLDYCNVLYVGRPFKGVWKCQLVPKCHSQAVDRASYRRHERPLVERFTVAPSGSRSTALTSIILTGQGKWKSWAKNGRNIPAIRKTAFFLGSAWSMRSPLKVFLLLLPSTDLERRSFPRIILDSGTLCHWMLVWTAPIQEQPSNLLFKQTLG